MSKFLQALKQAASEFIQDDCMSSGAAIAYYSIFALPPLLVMVFMLATLAGVSPEKINEVVRTQLGIPAAAGEAEADEEGTERSASQLQSVVDRTRSEQLGGIGPFGKITGLLILIFTATGLFAQLQVALNRAWGVEPSPERTGIKGYLVKRLLSLGMILVIALLLLVSLVFSTIIGQIIHVFQGSSPGLVVRILSVVLDNLLTLGLGTLLFAAIFKILPDTTMAWHDTWVGAALTALLFVAGKAIVAWYLQTANLGASWGDAAGSIIAVLAWLYYTSLIVLFGAELTQVRTRLNAAPGGNGVPK